MNTPVIEYYDYLLLLPYILIFFLLARRFAKKNAETSREFYWFLINWWIKMIAGIFYAWLIVYYYGYGDPLGYKNRSDEVLESVSKNWENIKYIFLPVTAFREYVLSRGYSSVQYLTADFAYYTEQNFMISRVSALTAFFTFNRFLIISFVFTNIAYYGFLVMYTASKKFIKGYNRQLALACLFIPSCIFWSSGLAKEPLCIIALGILFTGVGKAYIAKKISITGIVSLLFFSFILLTVKSYIFTCFIFSCIIWVTYGTIKNWMSRHILIKLGLLSAFIILTMGIVVFYGKAISQVFSSNIGDIISYNIDMYEVMASRARGSFIDVGDIDASSLGGILKFIPQGMANVFLRPFPWEIGNVLMIFTVLENLFLIFLLFRVAIKSRFFTKGLFIFEDYQVLAIVFSLTLAFVIAISTFNFGSMVRYKMPFLPFWASFLLIINKKLSGNKSIGKM